MRLSAICILVVVLSPLVASGAFLETSASITEAPDSWTHVVELQAFNPEMGELVAVHFSVAGHFSGSVRHENLDSAGTYYNDLMNWTLYVALVSSPRNSSLISFDDTLLIAGTLESFDGLMDYDGESGAERLLNTPITGGIVIQGEYALDFIGMGTVAIRVTASGTADLNMGGLAGLSQSTSACAATVTIIYEYALAPIINEAATWGDVKTLYR